MLARILAIGMLTIALVSTAGCSSVSQVLAPTPKVVTKAALVAAVDAEVDGELAPGLPEGTPLWPGAKVTYSGAAEQAYNLTLVATESYDDVLAGMAAGFENEGWDVAQEESGETGARTSVLTVSGPYAAGILTVTEVSDGTVGLAYVLGASE